MLEYLDKENDLLFTIEYVVNKTAKLNDLSDTVGIQKNKYYIR